MPFHFFIPQQTARQEMMPINSPRFGHRHTYIFTFYGKKQIPETGNMAYQMNEMDTYSTSSWSS